MRSTFLQLSSTAASSGGMSTDRASDAADSTPTTSTSDGLPPASVDDRPGDVQDIDACSEHESVARHGVVSEDVNLRGRAIRVRSRSGGADAGHSIISVEEVVLASAAVG